MIALRHKPVGSAGRVSTTPGLELIDVHALSEGDAAQWRAWQIGSERLRAPTLSTAYLEILTATRPDVGIARFAVDGHVAFLGIHRRKGHWIAGGLLFNDRQALIRSQEGPHDPAYLDAAPDLVVSSWRADHLPEQAGGLAAVQGFGVDMTQGLEAYLDDRKAAALDHLKKIRRRLRALEAAMGPIRLLWPDPCPNARKTLLAWKSDQFRRTGRHDILTSRWLRAFISAAFESDREDCRAELATLYAGDHLVAAEIGFTGLGVNQSWLAAYDQDMARFGPGTLLLQAIIEASPARGIDRIDLGPGHGAYKQYFANETYTVLSGRMRSRTLPSPAADLTRFASWAEQQRFPGARLPGKALRRYAMIEACEPSLLGRARGVLSALGAVSRQQRPPS